ncbi:unnamed protein product [Pleuronectes platessa]|uniref:Uncharacterized protein n=1 Tax=Pleuronectes platessa TaxID=8262 RepID=A0A9N7VRP7_PLEPL|nr:unnamed protein product [Pleuronectes platessa]
MEAHSSYSMIKKRATKFKPGTDILEDHHARPVSLTISPVTTQTSDKPASRSPSSKHLGHYGCELQRTGAWKGAEQAIRQPPGQLLSVPAAAGPSSLGANYITKGVFNQVRPVPSPAASFLVPPCPPSPRLIRSQIADTSAHRIHSSPPWLLTGSAVWKLPTTVSNETNYVSQQSIVPSN